MKKLLAVLLCLGLVGCATVSGVVPMGKDTYMLSRQAGTGFAGMGNLKADAFRDANEFCIKQGKQLQVVSTHEPPPPYVLGNFPRVEVQFMCLNAGDSELSRPRLKKEPDTVIEVVK